MENQRSSMLCMIAFSILVDGLDGVSSENEYCQQMLVNITSKSITKRGIK